MLIPSCAKFASLNACTANRLNTGTECFARPDLHDSSRTKHNSCAINLMLTYEIDTAAAATEVLDLRWMHMQILFAVKTEWYSK